MWKPKLLIQLLIIRCFCFRTIGACIFWLDPRRRFQSMCHASVKVVIIQTVRSGIFDPPVGSASWWFCSRQAFASIEAPSPQHTSTRGSIMVISVNSRAGAPCAKVHIAIIYMMWASDFPTKLALALVGTTPDDLCNV